MAKTIWRIFWLLIGAAGIGFGGYSVYQKQYFPISHQSFKAEGGRELLVPDMAKLKSTNGFDLLMTYGGSEWKDICEIVVLPDNDVVTMQIYEDAAVSTISFCSESYLFSNSNDKLVFSNEMVTVVATNKTYYTWRNNQFTVFSTKPIQPKTVRKGLTNSQGNADFFYKGSDGISEAIKLTNDVKYSAYLMEEMTVKGAPIDPLALLGVCPTNAEKINIYGSSRFQNDAANLQITDSVAHLNWVNREIMYIQKDSFEIIAGLQNDGILLKYLILEAEQATLSDTLIKSPIYFNNIEIMPFSVNWNWQLLCNDVKGEMNYFVAYNDFVFLTNELQGMYWLLKNIQLGKTYDAFQLRKKIPSRIHHLSILKLESGMAVSSKTWVTRNRSINLAAMTNQSMGAGQQLLTSFDFVGPAAHLFLLNNSADEPVVAVASKNTIKALNFKGDEVWNYSLNTKTTVKPVTAAWGDDGQEILFLIDDNELVCLNSEGKKVGVFNKKLANPITNMQLYLTDTDSLLLLQTSGGLLLLDSKGKDVPVGKNAYANLKYAGIQSIAKVPALVLWTSEDSLHVLDIGNNKKIGTAFYGSKINQPPLVLSGSALKARELKIMTANQNYLFMDYFSNGLRDSVELNKNGKPNEIKWINYKNRWLLVSDFYDKLIICNALGLSEAEIAKPEMNAVFVPSPFLSFGVFAFVNQADNTWYFTDEYGNLLFKKGIELDGNLGVGKKHIIGKHQNSIQIYKLN